MKPKIKSVIWKIRKQIITNQNNKRKKEFKKTKDSISCLLYTSDAADDWLVV